ncbi:MAG TPA: GNAT family N-acetyltransferase, partial [Saprospiraceae bacterium]|nr:GNAT family N-acetyltransferase [Saprospiraceae bacterium]
KNSIFDHNKYLKVHFMVSIIDFGSAEYDEAFTLRDKILRKPLGMEYTLEDLKGEEDNIHIAYFENGNIIGYLQLKPIQDQGIKMRQVAVDDQHQGKGIGKALVTFSENWCKNKAKSYIELHARDVAIPFYLKCGYSIEKEAFEEVGIPHRYMIKRF